MKSFNFIDCSGIGSSGKGAVVDLLSEYKGLSTMPHNFEFDLFRIKGGLNDLRKDFYEDWSPIRSNSAYWKFLKIINLIGKNPKGLNYFASALVSGNRYERTFDNKFISSSLNFLNSFVETEINGYWPFDLSDMSKSQLFFNKIKEKFFFKKNSYSRIKIINGDDFDLKLNDYLYKLFFEICDRKMPVLNNFLEPYNSSKSLNFFSKAKQIVVIRDPRDSFISGLSYGYKVKKDLKLIPPNNDGHSLSSVGSNNLESFILRTNQFYKILKKNSHERILTVRFEDLVLNYKETKTRIEKFIGLSDKDHIDKLKYFNPKKSLKNVMIWKKFSNQNTIEKIKNEIDHFTYKDH